VVGAVLLPRAPVEQQLADHAVTWGHRSQLPREIALVLAVFDLPEHHELKVCGSFVPPIEV